MWSCTLVNATGTLRVPHYFGGEHNRHAVPHVFLGALHHGSPSVDGAAGHMLWDVTRGETSDEVLMRVSVRELVSELNDKLEREQVIGE